MRVVLTGASGFLGRRLLNALLNAEHAVTPVVRDASVELDRRAWPQVRDLLQIDGWTAVLDRQDVVVHAAARAHVISDSSADPLAEYRRVNVQGTVNLARQAVKAGVRRFVFVSSIKVNGESTVPGRPFTVNDPPAPQDAYAISKLEAEVALRGIAETSGMEVVVVRPPLVYGPGAKANFATMMRWVDLRIPLPLGSVTGNRRSLVGLDNLVDLLMVCVTHPVAANQTFLVSDGEDLSTADLLRRMGQALGKPARLLSVPPALLRWGAAGLGLSQVAQRLCGSLQVDISRARELLAWTPPISVDEGLRRAVDRAR